MTLLECSSETSSVQFSSVVWQYCQQN